MNKWEHTHKYSTGQMPGVFVASAILSLRWSVTSTNSQTLLLNLILDVGVDYTKLREFAPQTTDSKPVSSVQDPWMKVRNVLEIFPEKRFDVGNRSMYGRADI